MKELKRISAFFMAMLMMLTVFSAFSVVSAEGRSSGRHAARLAGAGLHKARQRRRRSCRQGESLGSYPRHSGQKLRNNI